MTKDLRRYAYAILTNNLPKKSLAVVRYLHVSENTSGEGPEERRGETIEALKKSAKLE